MATSTGGSRFCGVADTMVLGEGVSRLLSRNLARFEAGLVTPAHVISQIEDFLCQMGKVRVFSKTSFAGDRDCPWTHLGGLYRWDKAVALVSWEKLPPGGFKLNTDASVLHGRAAGGGVLRDHCGRVIFAYYKEFGELDVLEAEAQSFRDDLHICANWAVCTLTVESESKVLVQLVNSDVVSKWPVYNVLREIRHFLHRMNAPLHHVFREANSVADAFASS
ncbi:uncharacterized protein [Coffea arabica]|uniref:RNase H type-1 domain-containing protein n=1 Tax=Coffea arabica TaxID=13443 RepID=A0ABM4W8M1_COFAR